MGAAVYINENDKEAIEFARDELLSILRDSAYDPDLTPIVRRKVELLQGIVNKVEEREQKKTD